MRLLVLKYPKSGNYVPRICFELFAAFETFVLFAMKLKRFACSRKHPYLMSTRSIVQYHTDDYKMTLQMMPLTRPTD